MRSEKGKIDDITFWVKNIIYRQIMTIVEDVQSIPQSRKQLCHYNLTQVLLLYIRLTTSLQIIFVNTRSHKVYMFDIWFKSSTITLPQEKYVSVYVEHMKVRNTWGVKHEILFPPFICTLKSRSSLYNFICSFIFSLFLFPKFIFRCIKWQQYYLLHVQPMQAI